MFHIIVRKAVPPLFSRCIHTGSTGARRLILVEFNNTRPKDPPVSLAMGSITAKLKSEGLEYDTYNVDVSTGKNVCVESILLNALSTTRAPCDIVAGAFVWNDVYVKRLLATLRARNFKGRIGLAGAQVTRSLYLSKYHVDVFCCTKQIPLTNLLVCQGVVCEYP